jgi:hypothetical protein
MGGVEHHKNEVTTCDVKDEKHKWRLGHLRKRVTHIKRAVQMCALVGFLAALSSRRYRAFGETYRPIRKSQAVQEQGRVKYQARTDWAGWSVSPTDSFVLENETTITSAVKKVTPETFEVLTAVLLKVWDLWETTSCCLVNSQQSTWRHMSEHLNLHCKTCCCTGNQTRIFRSPVWP